MHKKSIIVSENEKSFREKSGKDRESQGFSKLGFYGNPDCTK